MILPAVLAIFPFIAGYILDLLFGDPQRLPHPVRITGTLIQKLEPFLRKIFPETKTGERMAGIVLAVFVPGVSYAATAVLLILTGRLHIYARLALETLICYQLLAARGLHDESICVLKALETDGTQSARTALSRIVGRDTANLDERQIIMAAVETVAENTTDGVVAPMLFLAFGGAWGMLYKAVSTLDSMVGYKNGRYRFFGTASARLDDILNLIPARLASVFMLMAAPLLRLDFRRALRVFLRDRYNHESPNSAQTESVCAGALGIRLGGGASYGGVFHEKPSIGDDTRPPCRSDIYAANCLMLLTSMICLLFVCAVKFLILYYINV